MSSLRPGKSEKRDYLRMDIDTEVLCKIRGTKEGFKGRCKNLSHTGLQFVTTKHLKEGTELEIILKINGGVAQAPLEAIINVQRVNKNNGDQYTVSGIMKIVK